MGEVKKKVNIYYYDDDSIQIIYNQYPRDEFNQVKSYIGRLLDRYGTVFGAFTYVDRPSTIGSAYIILYGCKRNRDVVDMIYAFYDNNIDYAGMTFEEFYRSLAKE